LSNYIKKSVVVEVNDRKIGIVGYVTPETAVSLEKFADFK
jgi:2',3'-cyclic-nucleotide 2'-phosphodiesterase (5'-nucleotidase family)